MTESSNGLPKTTSPDRLPSAPRLKRYPVTDDTLVVVNDALETTIGGVFATGLLDKQCRAALEDAMVNAWAFQGDSATVNAVTIRRVMDAPFALKYDGPQLDTHISVLRGALRTLEMQKDLHDVIGYDDARNEILDEIRLAEGMDTAALAYLTLKSKTLEQDEFAAAVHRKDRPMPGTTDAPTNTTTETKIPKYLDRLPATDSTKVLVNDAVERTLGELMTQQGWVPPGEREAVRAAMVEPWVYQTGRVTIRRIWDADYTGPDLTEHLLAMNAVYSDAEFTESNEAFEQVCAEIALTQGMIASWNDANDPEKINAPLRCFAKSFSELDHVKARVGGRVAADLRESALSNCLLHMAAHHGVALQKPLYINARGEYSIVALHPDGRRPDVDGCGCYGEAFSAYLTQHNPRTGERPGAHLDAESGWCWMHHFDVQRMVGTFFVKEIMKATPAIAEQAPDAARRRAPRG